jgi:hypothetical protein
VTNSGEEEKKDSVEEEIAEDLKGLCHKILDVEGFFKVFTERERAAFLNILCAGGLSNALFISFESSKVYGTCAFSLLAPFDAKSTNYINFSLLQYIPAVIFYSLLNSDGYLRSKKVPIFPTHPIPIAVAKGSFAVQRNCPRNL